MGENSNNFPEPLTEADKELLDNVVLNFQVGLFVLTKKFPNPKKALEFIISQIVNRERGILLMVSLIYLRDKKDDDPFRPKDLIKFVKETLGANVNPVFIEIVQQLEAVSKNLDSRSAREKILEKLQNSNIIYNLSGMENYEAYMKQSPGRKSPDGAEDDPGGSRSIYLFESHIHEIREALRKKDSVDYVYNKLLKSNLLDTILSYSVRLLFYLTKQNDLDFLRINYFARLVIGRRISEEYFNELPFFCDKINKLDNSELKQLKEYLLKNLKEDKYLLFNIACLLGLLKL
jgi:hypothetical protein